MPSIPEFDRLGQDIIARLGLGGGSQYGGQTTPGSYGVVQRAVDSYRRGQAPLTMENIGRTFSNMAAVMGSSIVTTGISSIAELAAGQEAGSLGGIQNMEGYIGPSTYGKAMVASGKWTDAEARAFDRNNAARAGGERGPLAGGGKKPGDPGQRFGKGE